jgi:hypothetical protein
VREGTGSEGRGKGGEEYERSSGRDGSGLVFLSRIHTRTDLTQSFPIHRLTIDTKTSTHTGIHTTTYLIDIPTHTCASPALTHTHATKSFLLYLRQALP